MEENAEKKENPFTGVFNQRIVSSEEMLFYGIKEEDRELWNELIMIGDDISFQNVLKAQKAYLFTHVIGNSSDSLVRLLRNNEASYGNTMLHNRMINSHDCSIISPQNLSPDQKKLLNSNQKGADYLLRHYELKQKTALSASPEQATKKRNQLHYALTFKDAEGKTPLLLAIKNGNQSYARRLIKLDETKETINMPDNIENRTPLHGACILGLKQVANDLIEAGANKEALDKNEKPPFYYLTCDNAEKIQNIEATLESVNFFYGRYFNRNDSRAITSKLLEGNNALQKEWSELIQGEATKMPKKLTIF